MTASTFFEMQQRQRRRTHVLVAVEVLLLIAVGYVLTLPWQWYDSCSGDSWVDGEYVGCRPVGFSITTVALVALLTAAYLCFALLIAQRQAFPSVARPAGPDPCERRLVAIAEDMSIASGLPMPDVRVLDDPALNAFAAWDRGQPVIIATSGLLDALDERQLTGVVAHETAHLTNRDARIVWVALFGLGLMLFVAVAATSIGVAATMSAQEQQRRGDKEEADNNGAVVALVAFLFAAIMWIVVVPAALIVRAAISRRREQLADASAVQFTRDPTGLRQALEIIGQSDVPTSGARMANAALWIRHPGSDTGLPAPFGIGRLLDTHPPIAERIAWLRGLEGANAVWAELD
jgi:heat shock protein HtpX